MAIEGEYKKNLWENAGREKKHEMLSTLWIQLLNILVWIQYLNIHTHKERETKKYIRT